MLRLEGLGERKVAALSGGQRQRVALGRALAVNPRILLLNEPLSNLDARVREEVRHEIKTLQQNLGITTLHVTHDRQEAMVMADRIAILEAGHVAQIGAPEEIYNRPNSPFVASFMGAANAVPLIVRRSKRHLIIADGPYNRSVTIDASRFLTRIIDEICAQTSMVAHFRSEDARLCPLDQTRRQLMMRWKSGSRQTRKSSVTTASRAACREWPLSSVGSTRTRPTPTV
jgi:ABC-type Fe3+/spermidine/putrescine transport system ATPase subunit